VAGSAAAFVVSLDHAIGRIARPLVSLLPRRLRRAADLIERRRTRPLGQVAAVGFILAAILYGLIVGGQIGRVADAALVVAGFGIETIEIDGNRETSEIDVLEKLEVAGSLVAFDVAAAQQRVEQLPWVARATVRKFYPSTLAVTIEERKPFALWQHDGAVSVIDAGGHVILPLEEWRFAKLPLTVGVGANLAAADVVSALATEPLIADRLRAAVFVAQRRWDLHLEDGVKVKLPERDARGALTQLAAIDKKTQLLDRDVAVIDLRLADRVTVRLPEGRTLEEVVSPLADAAARSKT
jgi:cell division protein FtsQ